MKISLFSAKPYDKEYFEKVNKSFGFEIEYFDTHLGPHIINAIEDTDAVCAFVNDKVDAKVIESLAAKHVKIVALRCAGFNNVDLDAAKKYGMKVCRVPSYSPEAVAEHAIAMIQTLNRKTHKAYNRVREQNFSLNGLLGFDLFGKTLGVIGTGKIGKAFCKIMLGFGCQVKAFDVVENKELQSLGVEFLPVMDIFKRADIISLHCPLNENTRHLVNSETLQLMKKGVMLINTSRGGLIDTKAVIGALKSRQIGYLGIDVYEQEDKLFFRDLSASIIEDDTIQRLMSFPNVLVTAHQAFFTEEALQQIASTTLNSVHALLNENEISLSGARLV
jgi:D-lactate dehydrogenase